MKSDQYGVHITDFLRKYSSHDITELMAMDNLKDPEYIKNIEAENQAKDMTIEDQSSAIIALLGGKKNGNH